MLALLDLCAGGELRSVTHWGTGAVLADMTEDLEGQAVRREKVSCLGSGVGSWLWRTRERYFVRK